MALATNHQEWWCLGGDAKLTWLAFACGRTFVTDHRLQRCTDSPLQSRRYLIPC
jgi:hypothetical protein